MIYTANTNLDKKSIWPSITDKMVKAFFPVILLSFLFALAISFLYDPKQGFEPFRIVNFQGEVMVFQSEKNAWEKKQIGTKEVGYRDQIRTEHGGTITLAHAGGVEGNIYPRSAVDFRKPLSFRLNWVGERVHLEKGKMFFQIHDQGSRKALQFSLPGGKKMFQQGNLKYEVAAPGIVVEAYDAKIFFDMNAEFKQARVFILDGTVKVQGANPKQKFIMVQEGHQISLTEKDEAIQVREIVSEDLALMNKDTAAPFLKEYVEKLSFLRNREITQEIMRAREDLLPVIQNPRVSFSRNGAYATYEKMSSQLKFIYSLKQWDSFADFSFKVKETNLNQYGFLNLKIVPMSSGTRLPERVVVEMRSNGKPIRVFQGKGYSSKIAALKFPILIEQRRMVDEIKIRLRNKTLGEAKEGGFILESLFLSGS